MTAEIYFVLKLVHILGVVFMSAPFYSLIIVNERALFSSTMNFPVDRYMENLIKRQARRCFVFQSTVLISGISLVNLSPGGFVSIFTDWVLASKTIILLILIGLLTYIHFAIQPKIENLLSSVRLNPIPKEISDKIKPLRVVRKKLASLCLFFVLSAIILGMQVVVRLDITLNVILFILAAIFSWRAYKLPLPFGWF